MNKFTRRLNAEDFKQFFTRYRLEHDKFTKCIIENMSIHHGDYCTTVCFTETTDGWGEDNHDETVEIEFSLEDYRKLDYESIQCNMESTHLKDSVFWQQFLYDKFGEEYLYYIFETFTGLKHVVT